MPLVTTPEHRIFFAHVPKTGGSSVEDYLVNRFGGPLSLIVKIPRKDRRQPGLVTPATHLSAADLVDLLPPDIDYSFAVVRNPFTRMQSEYRFQTGASRTARLSYSTWLRLMVHCVRIDARAYQNHVRPQTDLVPEGAESFRMEDGFGDMIARLDEVTGATAPGVEVGHLLKRKREPLRFSRQDVELLEQFYAEDYSRFGYEKLDTADLPDDRWAGLRDVFARVLAQAVMYKQRRTWFR